MKFLLGTVFSIALAVASYAQAQTPAPATPPRGKSGLLQGVIKLEQQITLSSGKPLVEKPYELEAGKYYRLTIVADGSAELALTGSDFFRNVWINEIVIKGIEVRPLGVDSIEFDEEGEAVISFVTIRPGTFTLRIPKTTSETQQVVFNVK